jgi:hypothetical protein
LGFLSLFLFPYFFHFLLREAGFAEVECFWRRAASSICCGLRAR